MIRLAVILSAVLSGLVMSAANAATIEVPPLIYRPAEDTGSAMTPSPDETASAASGANAIATGGPVTIRTRGLRYRPPPTVAPEREIDPGDGQPPPRRSAPIAIRTPPLSYRTGTAATTPGSAGSPILIRSQALRYRPESPAGSQSAADLMRYVEFPAAAVSSPRLRIDAPLTGIGEPLVVRYSGLDSESRHVLFAWNLLKHPRIMAQERTRAEETSGTWSPTPPTAGSYRICIAADERSLEARRAPERADECVAASVVWGDPAQPPRPVIEIEPAEPIAATDFELRYRGMPEAEDAKIFVYPSGAGAYSMPVLTIATEGRESGSPEPRIWDPGDYEIRVVYEMSGRQTRAVRPLRVLPRAEESTR
jgi:hypothetical protein